jgi:peptidoglycan/LPS O-acetylase OafA/YrhL
VKPAREEFLAGDPIRGVAACAIVVVHTAIYTGGSLNAPDLGPLTWLERLPLRVIASGDLALFVFYVLSGYLLGRPFVAWLLTDARRPNVRRYLRNRALRILPALWAAWLVTLILFGTERSSVGQILAVPLLFQNYVYSAFSARIGQAWTVDVEAAFYVVLPVAAALLTGLLVRYAAPRTRLRVLLASLAAIAVASLVWRGVVTAGATQYGVVDRRSVHGLASNVFAFMPGIALAVVAELRPRALLRPNLPHLLVLVAVPAYLAYMWDALGTGGAIHGLLGGIIATCLVGGPLLRQFRGAGVPHLLTHRTVRWLGERSYSMYVFHVAVLGFLVQHLHPGYGTRAFVEMLVLVALLVPPIIAVTYRYIERPFLQGRRPWGRGGGQEAGAGAAAATSAGSVITNRAPG